MIARFPSMALIALAVPLAACGGGGGGPTTPPPVATHQVGVALFYDENGNGMLDAVENVRIPDAVVEVGGKQGRTAPITGEVIVDGVTPGAHTVTVRAASLPPFYVPPAAVGIVVPQTVTTFVPVTLPIGPNRPNVYLAFGDSITAGDGSTDEMGYVLRLQRKLQGHFGRATVVKDGFSFGRSNSGAVRLGDSLTIRPAYTLIHYGTNDWNAGECKFSPPCFTIEALRSMVRQVKGRQGLPVLATIIPANPAHGDYSPDRNPWVAGMNARIRELARSEGAVLADLEAAFLRAPGLPALFSDHVHPNDAGYEIMAQAFFDAITKPPPAAAGLDAPVLFDR